jgi:hypothetical protein
MDVRRHAINDMRLATETSLDFSAVAETIGAAVPVRAARTLAPLES